MREQECDSHVIVHISHPQERTELKSSCHLYPDDTQRPGRVLLTKMASDSEPEINVEEVVENIAVSGSVEDGVEVETILQGQSGGPGDLDYIVQEEVETTTENVLTTTEVIDPVDNVIIALQNTDQQDEGLPGGSSAEYNTPNEEGSDHEVMSSRKRRSAASSSRSNPRKKSRKGRKGARFVSRRNPIPLATSQSVKDSKEANEASFDPTKTPRRWSQRKVPIKTLDGGEFSVNIWTTGMCGRIM